MAELWCLCGIDWSNEHSASFSLQKQIEFHETWSNGMSRRVFKEAGANLRMDLLLSGAIICGAAWPKHNFQGQIDCSDGNTLFEY